MGNATTAGKHEPSIVTVYEGSVCTDVLITTPKGKEGLVTTAVYENITIEGNFTHNIHPNLHKKQAYQCTPDDKMESSSTDLVISRDGTSARFGEYDHMTSKGRVLTSRGASAKFEKDIENGLGLHYAMETTASVVIYTEKDDPSLRSNGVVVLAPNFTLAQDKEYTPVLSMNRSGYTNIKPDAEGCIRNIHVKGSVISDSYISLDTCRTSLTGGWYFGQHSGDWFKPPKEMVIPEKQAVLMIVQPADLVISRGNASVLLRPDGGVFASGVVAVLLLPFPNSQSGDKDCSEIKTFVIFQ